MTHYEPYHNITDTDLDELAHLYAEYMNKLEQLDMYSGHAAKDMKQAESHFFREVCEVLDRNVFTVNTDFI